MKKSMKYLVLGIVIGAISASIPALAEVIWERIDVVRNQIKVVVHGEEIKVDNFLYNDTTYIPLRAVSEAMGLSVEYDNGVAIIDENHEVVFEGEKSYHHGYEITTEESNDYIKVISADKNYKGLTEEEKQTLALDTIIDYRILREIAKENNIVLGKSFNDYYTNTLAFLNLQYGGTENVKKAMQQSGFTDKMYKRFLETNYLESELLECEKFSASDFEVKKYYNENQNLFQYDGVQAQHILLKTVDENGKQFEASKLAEIKSKANEIYKMATKDGADFDELIARYNEDPGMASNPEGYIFTRGQMVPEFEEVAFEINPGDISEPIKTDYGWHIIKKIRVIKTKPITAELYAEIAQEVSAQKIADEISKRAETVKANQ